MKLPILIAIIVMTGSFAQASATPEVTPASQPPVAAPAAPTSAQIVVEEAGRRKSYLELEEEQSEREARRLDRDDNRDSFLEDALGQ